MSALRDAYELIKDEDRWCTGTAARDASGDSIPYNDPNATRWCALGAVGRVGASLEVIGRLQGLTWELFPGQWINTVNDNLGHEAVLQIYEKALVEEEGGL